MGVARNSSSDPSASQIFLEFLFIGISSVGGGVVSYLQRSIVGKREWIDDKTFLELLSISQTLPGLNATNLAVLIGDRLRGGLGSLLAVVGICFPGALVMIIAGVLYREHADHPTVNAMLRGVTAAAVGMIFATIFKLSRNNLGRRSDAVFLVCTLLGVLILHQSALLVLVLVGLVSISFRHVTYLRQQAKGRADQ